MENTAATARTLRERLPLAPVHDPYFRWRGKEVSRLEGLTDAVFAFAVTLLVVALEVPKTFEGLMDVVRAFPAFVICFALLMNFWTFHYQFFRRYGLEDGLTRSITMGLLVLVLFSVYPLKFLFSLISASFGLEVHDTPHLDALGQIFTLYVIYGLGFAGVWALYALLYVHAWRLREALELNASEIVLTKASLYHCLINIVVCLFSVLLALSTSSESLPGFVYWLLAPALTTNGVWTRRKARALHAHGAVPAPSQT